MDPDPADDRERLGRIRCLADAMESLTKGENLPWPICFVPKSLTFEISDVKEPLSVCDSLGGKVIEKIPEGKTIKISCKGQPLFDNSGGWVQMLSPHQGWLLMQPLKATVRLVPPNTSPSSSSMTEATHWLEVVEQVCTLHSGKQPQLTNQDEEEMEKLKVPPPGWNLEADEELAQFLIHCDMNTDPKVQGTEHFEKVEASYERGHSPDILSDSDEEVEVSSEGGYIQDMLDSDLNKFWESEVSEGEHWLRFYMKPGTLVEKFALLIDPHVQYTYPRHAVVKAGSPGNVSVIATRDFVPLDFESRTLQLFLAPLSTSYEVIEVYLKCYPEELDACRLNGVSVITPTFFTENLSKSVFTPERIARYPKLQPFQPEQLFYRGLLLKRIAHLLNVDLTYLLPQIKESSASTVGLIHQLLPLCTQRNSLCQILLSKTSTGAPSLCPPTLHINRKAAKQHMDNPSQDPECKGAVFNQVMAELEEHTKDSDYNFRWAGRWDQWWDCKFIQEKLIDQGDEFRNSLADMAEELCPSDPDSEVALPLFVRSHNQSQDSSNVYRDTYIPSPSCTLMDKYYFIGQLMGAMVRRA